MKMRARYLELIICLILATATLAVYWQVTNHEFINFDDNTYITENPHVRAGLTKKSIHWGFTSFHMGNWHPLTWISHILDCELFRLDAGMHHLTNLLFHMANSILLFVVLRRMTGSIFRSGFVAALFALHPLHVESVAWIAERKDVLSSFFWMLTMLAYTFYADHPKMNRYILVVIFFTLGLMAKPMVVTLPFVLLLMDFWPLDRMGASDNGNSFGINKPIFFKLIYEKIPLFGLVVIFSVIAFVAQEKAGAVQTLDSLSVQTRVANALVSYIGYIGNTIWPDNLAIFYPRFPSIPLWKTAGSGLLLVCISAVSLKAARSYPYIIVGWLWYLGTLVPVIGLIQVGDQSMADRYTYIPLIGLFVMIGWGVPDLLRRWRCKRIFVATSGIMVVLALMICTWRQVQHWKDSITLFRHTLNVSSDNYLAHNNLGVTLDRLGSHDEAINHYQEALRIKPMWAEALYNLGVAKAGRKKFEESIEAYSESIRLRPGSAKTHNNMANALLSLGRIDSAIEHYLEAIKARPDYANAHSNLGIALVRKGKIDEAIVHFREALRINPDDARIRQNLDQSLRQKYGGRRE